MDIIERIDHWAQVNPEKAAHISSGQTLTYAGLFVQSNKLAEYLMNALPDDNSPIVILGHKHIEMTIGFIASIKSGHPYIPLESHFPEQRVNTVVETAQASLVLTVEKIQEVLDGAKENPAFKPRVRKQDDTWYIIFTSGSTGNPKGVVIPRANLENFLNWTLPEHKITNDTVILGQAPFTFDVSILDLYCSLYQGGTLVSVTKDEITNLKELFHTLKNSNATMWVSTPSFARLCLMDPSFGESMIPTLRRFWLAGEALAPEICVDLLKRFPKTELWNAYGPTEATVATTSVEITPDILAKYNPVPIGYAMPGTQIFIHDKDNKPVLDGERGEIIICGPNVSLGYINRPDLTAKAFFELNGQRAYHTGDLGRYRDGMVFYEGRIDFQIKLHGYRIELGDIEANLHALTEVQDAVIVPVMNGKNADYLVAFVILKTKTDKSDFENMQGLKKELGERVPEYMIPRKFVFLREFPMTSNGKADRRKLAETLQ
ncbi:MAG TPA: D-alanine--poly(phosphoribitol) ligase subunit DltA [Anaerolineales bacterium]|nr:D-alanine--poly(phosphoribitol) ligase subunit DltA [Anaerolineales bacterium]